MKNKINKIKNTLERINSKLDDTQEWFSDLEDRLAGITWKKWGKIIFKNENSLTDLWNNVNHTNFAC